MKMRIIMLLAIVIAVASCTKSTVGPEESEPVSVDTLAPVDVPGYNLEIVRIRGCEYVYTQSYAYMAGMICHAGDCDNPAHHADKGSE